MKKRLTRGEKWLFASPLLFLVIAGVTWQWRKTTPFVVELPDAKYIAWLNFSPDSQRLVVFANGLKVKRPLGRVFDLESLKKVCDMDMKSVGLIYPDFGPPAWSSDGKAIVSVATSDVTSPVSSKAVIWDGVTGTLKTQHVYPAGISTLIRYAPDGKSYIGVGTPPPRFDAVTGKRLNHPYKNVKQGILARSNEKSGLCAIDGVGNSEFRVIDLKSSKVLWQPNLVTAVSFEWYNDVLAVNAAGIPKSYPEFETGLLLWDGKTRQRLPTPPSTPDGEVIGFSFNPAQSTIVYSQSHVKLAAGGTTNAAQSYELVLWDYRANRVLWRYPTASLLSWLEWSPDGKRLAAQYGRDGESFVVVLGQNGQPQFERGSVSGSQFNYWSPDSKKLAIVMREKDNAANNLDNRLEIYRFED